MCKWLLLPLELFCKGFVDINYENASFRISDDSICQPTFTCSKLTIETLEQGVKYLYC